MRAGPLAWLPVGAVLAAAFSGARARAAGYEQPVPFVARQLAVGGTALAAVDDPSAPVANPAELAWIEQASGR